MNTTVNSMADLIGIFIGITLRLLIDLGENDILLMLRRPKQEQSMSLRLFKFSLVYSGNIL